MSKRSVLFFNEFFEKGILGYDIFPAPKGCKDLEQNYYNIIIGIEAGKVDYNTVFSCVYKAMLKKIITTTENFNAAAQALQEVESIEKPSNLYATIKYDSYITNDSDLAEGGHRLLETDIPLVLPVNVHIRFLVTSNDVLHSFAVPSLGIKIDATPGRICSVPVYISQVGRYFGQCSEICGTGHAFMPIYIVAVKPSVFEYFIEEL